MTDRLKNKVALVTAAGQGIGRAIAEAFIAEGARVIATDAAADKLKGLKAAKSAKLDVLSTKAVDAFAKSVAKDFGALNVLVNVAGYVHQGTVLECSEKDWDFSFDLNVKSMHRTIRAFLPAMLESGRGSIVNMSSVFSIKGPKPLCLWCNQSCRNRPHQSRGRRFHHQGHSLQCHLPRHHCLTVVRGTREGGVPNDGQIRQAGARQLHRASADGAARHRRGSGRARGFPGLG